MSDVLSDKAACSVYVRLSPDDKARLHWRTYDKLPPNELGAVGALVKEISATVAQRHIKRMGEKSIIELLGKLGVLLIRAEAGEVEL